MLMAACAVVPVENARAQECQALTDYWGFAWEKTPDGPLTRWKNGNTYTMVGEIDEIFTPLTSNLSVNEYTVYISNLVEQGDGVVVGSGNDPFKGPYTIYRVAYSDGGVLSMYEDAAKDHVYATNPPNAQVPSTFTNGALYLQGSLSDFTLYVTVYSNGDELGSFEALAQFNSGSHISEIGGASAGYTFSGLTKNRFASIPTGYNERVDGQTFNCPSAVKGTTWGGIKSLYR
jgi:hypothetical protein